MFSSVELPKSNVAGRISKFRPFKSSLCQRFDTEEITRIAKTSLPKVSSFAAAEMRKESQGNAELASRTSAGGPFLTSPLGENFDPQGQSCPPGVNL
jgi:hypothetical protein